MTFYLGHRLNLKHGMSKHPLHNVWRKMKQRCYTITDDAYHYYGGRGIKVCDRWLKSFENFYADMGDKPGPGYSLDRIDNNGGYSPENCRWATVPEQMKNRRKKIICKRGHSIDPSNWRNGCRRCKTLLQQIRRNNRRADCLSI